MSDIFDPSLLYNANISFEERSEITLDELSQMKIKDENLRRCFSLRVASRIVSLIYMQGALAPENNFIANMDKVTRRFSELFNSAFDFLKLNSRAEDFHYILPMMNNAVVDFLTTEYQCLLSSTTPDSPPFSRLEVSEVFDLLTTVLLTQKYEFITYDENDHIIYPDISVLGDSQKIRKLSLMEATLKCHGLSNMFDYYQTDINAFVHGMVTVIAQVSEEQISRVWAMNEDIPPSFSMVYQYYQVCIGLFCEIYKRCAKNDVIELELKSPLDRNLVITRYMQGQGMPHEHIYDEFRKAIGQMADHTAFLLNVHYQEQQESQSGHEDT